MSIRLGLLTYQVSVEAKIGLVTCFWNNSLAASAELAGIRGARAAVARSGCPAATNGSGESGSPWLAAVYGGAIRWPVEPEPDRPTALVAVDSPVAVSGDGGDDAEPAPVLVVVGVFRPGAALVDDFYPRVVTGVESHPDRKRAVRMTGPAVQDGVGRQLGRQQDHIVSERAPVNERDQISAYSPDGKRRPRIRALK